jgi:hypothetical protein
VKPWERIAENIANAGFSWGCSSDTDSNGRVLYTVDAYAKDARRFTVLADERLTAFWTFTQRFTVRLKARRPDGACPISPRYSVTASFITRH